MRLPYAPWRRLIEDRPEEPKLSDGFDKIVEAHRLDHVRVHPRAVASGKVFCSFWQGLASRLKRLASPPESSSSSARLLSAPALVTRPPWVVLDLTTPPPGCLLPVIPRFPADRG